MGYLIAGIVLLAFAGVVFYLHRRRARRTPGGGTRGGGSRDTGRRRH